MKIETFEKAHSLKKRIDALKEAREGAEKGTPQFSLNSYENTNWYTVEKDLPMFNRKQRADEVRRALIYCLDQRIQELVTEFENIKES
jgi:hypothetical protein